LAAKLAFLRREQARLRELARANDEKGARVAVAVSRRGATPAECDKYKLHAEEVGKIASLAAGLASRLARAENQIRKKDKDAKVLN